MERQVWASSVDAAVNEPEVQEMIKRVNFYKYPEAEAAEYDKMTTIIKIHLKNFGKGSPTNPMSYEEVTEKFRQSADFAQWPRAEIETLINLVNALETVTDMRKLTAPHCINLTEAWKEVVQHETF